MARKKAVKKDEAPYFVLSGDDLLAEPVIAYYLTLVTDPTRKAKVRASVKEFQDFRNDNPDRMKQ
jgi:hypothetical protein